LSSLKFALLMEGSLSWIRWAFSASSLSQSCRVSLFLDLFAFARYMNYHRAFLGWHRWRAPTCRPLVGCQLPGMIKTWCVYFVLCK
jgi:hypothetical protein